MRRRSCDLRDMAERSTELREPRENHMPAASTTVIVGAGFGGIAAARRLRTLLPEGHRILVVDRRPEVSLGAGHTWVMTGRKRPEQVSKRLSAITRHGLEFRCAEVVAVDPSKRTVEIAGDRVQADALLLAPGAQLTLDPLPGAAGVAHQFYELEGAIRLLGALDAFGGGRVLITIIAPPYKCPAAPHEAALLLHEKLRKKPGPDRFSVAFVTPEPQPMPVAGPTVGAAIRELYEQRGITARFGAKPARVHTTANIPAGSPPSRAVPGELELGDGKREPFDLLIAVPAHTAPTFPARQRPARTQRLGAGRPRHAGDAVRRRLGDRRRDAYCTGGRRNVAESRGAGARRRRGGGERHRRTAARQGRREHVRRPWRLLSRDGAWRGGTRRGPILRRAGSDRHP
jgi:NADPH-dependent 2,4-dienoyl-CoA reductase/sulfur reductase-like enzyme